MFLGLYIIINELPNESWCLERIWVCCCSQQSSYLNCLESKYERNTCIRCTKWRFVVIFLYICGLLLYCLIKNEERKRERKKKIFCSRTIIPQRANISQTLRNTCHFGIIISITLAGPCFTFCMHTPIPYIQAAILILLYSYNYTELATLLRVRIALIIIIST